MACQLGCPRAFRNLRASGHKTVSSYGMSSAISARRRATFVVRTYEEESQMMGSDSFDEPMTVAVPVEVASSTIGNSATGNENTMAVSDIKAALLDSFYGTERGLTARSEVRAEINELISQLEAFNPTPEPTEALDKLSGDWKLVYTSNSEIIAFLALSKLGPFTLGDITQRVDSENSIVENTLQVNAPLSSTTVSAVASFEVQSPKRVKVKFEKGKVRTDPVFESLELPASVNLLGQSVDVSFLTNPLQPVFQQGVNLLTDFGTVVKSQPDVQFPLPGSEQASTWLLTTYLDDDLRIARGDGGSVFVLTKL